ncbi:MAG: hypothetical protein JW736_01735 [Deltaproteobacteria bacterium]|nr:hypothetical protein [Deltaproteobacteria bacterium]MBN2688191.1 hypothetical protein [Deltaproteobacteria bacterium]
MNRYDHLEIRCPRLGGEVTFRYCREENKGMPCSRAIRCWQIYFPVEEYLKERLSPEEWDRCFGQPPKDKIATIFEIVERLKKEKQATE